MLDTIKKDAQTRMTKSVESLRHDLTHLRTGRASVALVDQLQVPYYGSDVPLPQVANIAVADARSLTITPFEKTMVAVVEKAILASNLGLTPTTVGQVIRINLPALTEQRRRLPVKAKMPRSPSATSAAMPSITSRNCSRTRRSARTRNVAVRMMCRN